MQEYIWIGFNDEMEKLSQMTSSSSSSYVSVSKGSKGAKAPGTGLGVSTRSPWYREKQKATPAPDLGSDLNRTSAKGV